MKVKSISSVKNIKINSPLFTGVVSLQTFFSEINECDLSISYVHFSKGIHNKFHKHTTDQILIVTEGKGFVATMKKKIEVGIGDIIWTPAKEIHKHGALPGQKFSHIAITRSNSKLNQIEK